MSPTQQPAVSAAYLCLNWLWLLEANHNICSHMHAILYFYYHGPWMLEVKLHKPQLWPNLHTKICEKKTLIVSTISLFEWEQLLVLRDMHDSVRRASAEINTKSTLAICYPDQQVGQRRERQIHQRVRLIHTVTHTHTNVVKHAHMYTHTVYFPTFELYSTTITSFIQARNSI